MAVIPTAGGVGTKPEMARSTPDVIATRGRALGRPLATRKHAAGGTGGTVKRRTTRLVYRSARYRHLSNYATFAFY